MRTLIFDLDGTLADLWPVERRTLTQMVLKNNVSLKRVHVARTLNRLKRSGISNILELYYLVSLYPLPKKKFYETYDQMQRKLMRKNGYGRFTKKSVAKILSRIQTPQKFALITGSSKQEAVFVLNQLGVLHMFEKRFIITKDDTPAPKKTGKPFLQLPTKIRRNAVMIGDSQTDKEGAEKVGIPCVLIDKKKPLTAALRTAIQTASTISPVDPSM